MSPGSGGALRTAMAVLRGVTGGMLLVLLVFGLANVALRWVGDTGFIWYNDLARFGLVWATMIGAAIVTFLGEHLVVNEKLPDRFPPWLAGLATGVRIGAILLFLVVVLVEGTRLTFQVANQGFVTVRWLPLALGYAALPVGAAAMLAAVLLEAVQRWRDRGKRTS